MEKFREFIEKYTILPLSDWEQIALCFEKKIFKKGDIILENGKICRHLYFLESGLLRYYIYKDGNDITKFFTEAPYCFTSQVSFTTEMPANENIEAIEDSIIWQATLKQVNELFELKSWNNFARKLIQEVQFYTEQILEEIQTETAENRYKNMLKNEAELLKRIPLKYLASYFGIAPQSLSRIRKKLS